MNSSTELSKLYRLGNDKAELILRQESVIAAMTKGSNYSRCNSGALSVLAYIYQASVMLILVKVKNLVNFR